VTILVTGGAGFIGSNFVLDWLRLSDEPVVNLDCLTYAGNPGNLASLAGDARHCFVRGSIADARLVAALLHQHQVRAVVNFAAESHVDRSIADPAPFFETNVTATLQLLEAVHAHFKSLAGTARRRFRFLHVSTDEVYGSLGPRDPAFTEAHPYRPNNPYAASKAASDHLIRAFGQTYGIPVLITNCSNNYGPRQFPEKLIPLVLHNALSGKPLPVYGSGQQVRDWLYVGDHCAAIRQVLERAAPGETFNVGGGTEMTNIDVVQALCELLDARRPRADGGSYARQVTHVEDRPGHDRRYAVDTGKIRREIGWEPSESFASGIARTVDWYLANSGWVAEVTSGAYRDWVARQYA